MIKSTILVLALIATALAADMNYYPNTYVATEGQSTNSGFQIYAINGTLYNVQFTITPDDPNVGIYYPGGASYSNIGTITNGASGSGAFQILTNQGQYVLTFNITYKKSNTLSAPVFRTTLKRNLTVACIYSCGGDGKREIKLDEDLTLAVRTADVTIYPGSYQCMEGQTTWMGIQVTAGANLNTVAFAVYPDDIYSVGIYYPNGNSMGTINTTKVAYGSFQILSNQGYYNLKLNITYKKGSTSYSYANTVPLTVASATSGSGDGKRLALMEQINGQNNSDALILSIVGIGAGVTLFAVVAIIVAVVVVKKRQSPTATA